MDFRKVINGVMSLATYKMMRESGSTAEQLIYFHDHKTLEQQYLANIQPEQLGEAIIDAATHKALGYIN